MSLHVKRTALMILFLLNTVLADIQLINYQGFLKQNGKAVNADNQSMFFSIYPEAVNTGASSLWNETQLVNIQNGHFQVNLGAVTNTDSNPNNDLNEQLFEQSAHVSYYLEIIINGETLTPRQRITNTPFAMKAAVAENAETLNGKSAGELDQSLHVLNTSNPHGVTAAQIGALTTETDPTVPASIKDGISWEELSNIPSYLGNNGIQSSGNVGIGVSTPSEKLEVNGSIKLHSDNSSIIFEDGTTQKTAFTGSGPGSGLDADTLDGLHAEDIAAWSGTIIPQGSMIPLNRLQIGSYVNASYPDCDYILDGKSINIWRDKDGANSNLPTGYLHSSPIIISHTILLSSANPSSLYQWYQSGNPTNIDIKIQSSNISEVVNIQGEGIPIAISRQPISNSAILERVTIDLRFYEPAGIPKSYMIFQNGNADVNANWVCDEGDSPLLCRGVKNSEQNATLYDNGSGHPSAENPQYGAVELYDLGLTSARVTNNYLNDATTLSRISIKSVPGDVELVYGKDCNIGAISGLSLDSEAEIIIEKATFYCECFDKDNCNE